MPMLSDYLTKNLNNKNILTLLVDSSYFVMILYLQPKGSIKCRYLN